VQLFDVRSNEFEHLSDYGYKYYIGQHMFSSATDLKGNNFGLAKQDRTPAPFHGSFTPTRVGSTGLGDGFGFVDRFLGVDLLATTHFPYSAVDNGTAATPPTITGLATQTYAGHLNPGQQFFYVYVAFDAFGGHVASNEVSIYTNATSSFINANSFTVNPPVGTDHVKVYRGLSAGTEVEIATIALGVLSQYPSGYTFTDNTPETPVSSTAPVLTNTFATLFTHQGRLYSTADAAHVVRDGGLSDVDIECDFDYAFGGSIRKWAVRFRGTADTDYFEVELDVLGGPTWTLRSVVAGTPTTLVTGSYSFIQPFTLAVKAVADQVLIRTSDATGRLHQVLLDDFTAATHSLNTDHAGGTREGFTLPVGGAATYFVDHMSTIPNPDGTDVKLDYNGMPNACFVIPSGLDTSAGGYIVAYSAYTIEGTAGTTLTAKLIRRKQINYAKPETLDPTLYLFGSNGFASSSSVNHTDGKDRTFAPGDLLDLYLNIPAALTTAQLNTIWTVYLGGLNS
ncbi:MAG: hypothetical protein ABIQ39_05535, partial [Ilumatobacteraceae bacterium]